VLVFYSGAVVERILRVSGLKLLAAVHPIRCQGTLCHTRYQFIRWCEISYAGPET